MRHRRSYVEANGELPVTVGFVRLVNERSPRVPAKSAGIGAHHSECSDDTIIIGLTWDDVYAMRRHAVASVTKRHRWSPMLRPRKLVRLA